MAKQTIQIADKPTLDEIKALLEDNGYGLEALQASIKESAEQDAKEIIYGTNTYVKNTSMTTYLNINGKGTLYVAAIHGQVSRTTPSLYLRVTIDGVVKFYKSTYYANTTGTAALYNSLGIFTKEYLPDSYNTSNNAAIAKLNMLTYKFYNTNSSDFSFTDGATVSMAGGLIARIFDKPLKFNSNLKVEFQNIAYDTDIRVLYSLD